MKGKIELCKIEVVDEDGDTMLTYCIKEHCLKIEIFTNIGDMSDYLLATILKSVKIRFKQYNKE